MPTKAPPPPLGFMMSRLAEVLRGRTAAGLAEFGLSPREYGLLWRLDAHGPLSQRQLGELHQIDRTTVVAVVDHLESAGLVVRAADPRDRRRHAISLTDHGRARLAEAGVTVRRVEDEFTAALPSTERRRLVATLSVLLDAGVDR